MTAEMHAKVIAVQVIERLEDQELAIERQSELLESLTGKVERLRYALHKASKWGGWDLAELIEEGYLEEGDLDEA